METQILTWSFMVSAAIIADIAAYIFLRLDWKKNGITLTDKFWNQVFDRADAVGKSIQTRISILLVKYHRASITDTPAAVSQLKPSTVAPASDSVPVEIVPVLVHTTGNVRHVKFFVDMPLDTQVEVRIGATREAGVKVEKREL